MLQDFLFIENSILIRIIYIFVKNNIMESIKERQKICWDNMSYSLQRIDLLIISISGAGIYFCLEAIKFLIEHKITTHWSIKIAGPTFIVSIILNVLSQWYGFKGNEQEYLICQTKLDCENNPTEDDQSEIDDYTKKSKFHLKVTNVLNFTSMLTMFLGLLVLVFYFIFIFLADELVVQ